MHKVPLTHSQLGSTVQSPHTHSDLSLPIGSTIGQTDTEIEGAHTKNRFAIVDLYAAKLKQLLKDGGEKAAEDWWKSC